ncbi:MAG: triose-phosphate isomerase [Pseudomonadota bacterium]
MTVEAQSQTTDQTSAATSTTVRPVVAGNWKMNGLKAALTEAMAVEKHIVTSGDKLECDVMICPPATLLMVMAQVAGNGVRGDKQPGKALSFGGQDCHAEASGAHTGDLSPEILKDAGATCVIVGHSERRADHGETDSLVKQKAAAAHRAGLVAIVCIGETIGHRQAGLTLEVAARQLAGSLPEGATPQNTIIAYEPVWAIGTGITPTADDVQSVHAEIRTRLEALLGEAGKTVRILYGGSVKPANAKELMGIPHVNGALVGGASLKASDFTGIIDVYRAG